MPGNKIIRLELTAAEIGALQSLVAIAIQQGILRRYDRDWFDIACDIDAKIQTQFEAQAGPR